MGEDSTGTESQLNDLWKFDPSTELWTWVGGSNTVTCVPGSSSTTCYVAGNYGQQGVQSATNMPGSRRAATGWTDRAGNLWLFGGLGADSNGYIGALNDFWEFDPTSNRWTWMGGTKSLTCTNLASGICLATTTPSGVYGSLGQPAAANIPSGRGGAIGWTDRGGALWLFGGGGPDDVWRFDTSLGQWAWMAGSKPSSTTISYTPAVYGTLGVSSNANTPGGRDHAASWTDKLGNLWLYGGQSGTETVDSHGCAVGFFDDLWVFDSSITGWAWMGGSSVEGNSCSLGYYNLQGVYGTLGISAAGNLPGSRAVAPSWTDANGDLWLFGGAISPIIGEVDDLWEYQPSVTSLPPAITPVFSPPMGTYSSSQSVSISNGMTNGSIYYTTDGTTPSTKSTLYSGPINVSATETINAIAVADGYPSSAVASAAYTIALPAAASPTFNVAAGTYTSAQTVTINDSTPGAIIYYTTNGNTPSTSSTQYSTAITVASSETIKAIAVAAGYSTSPIASVSYTISPPPTFSLSASSPALTISPGGSGTVNLTVTPQNGFNSAVSFACSGLPSGTTCSFSPATVTPSGAAVSTQLTMTASAQAALQSRPNLYLPGTALATIVCFFSLKRRRTFRLLIPIAVIAVVASLVSGCGSGSGSTSTPKSPTTSTVTVTAASGSIQQTAAVSLTIN